MFVIFVQKMYTLLPFPSLPLFPELPLQVSRRMGALIEYSTLMYKSETHQMHLLLLCIVGKPTPLLLRKEAG